MIEVPLTGDAPVYVQIAEALRLAVASGCLAPGTRLEPVRQMARRLKVNPGTVERAYRLLEGEGVIQTNRRGGSVVARGGDGAALAEWRRSRLRGLVERSLLEALAHGYSLDEIEAAFGLSAAAWRARGAASGPAGLTAGGEQAADAGRLYRFAGSHDLAIESLWVQARRADPALAFTARYVGSLDGLLALLHGEVALAGCHILDEETGENHLPILRRLFPGGGLCLVTLAEREQGLMVAPGNPRRIATLADLAAPGLRFVNRQPGSGTRTLLDHGLRHAGIPPSAVSGYDVAAPTHLAVAAAVAAGRADVGLGLYAAARAFALDFVPLARERYDLVLPAADRDRPPLAGLLALLGTPEFRAAVAQLGGYDTAHTGAERRL